MKIYLILLLPLLTSCSKWFEVKQGNGQLYIDDLENSVIDIDESTWKVGKKKDQIISKGLKIKFKMPKIDKDNAQKLFNNGGINSWIFRINKKSGRGKKPIGHIIYNLQSFNNVSDSVTAYIYYHSAAAGSEFRRQKCPAFKHNKKITDYELIDTPKKSYDLFVRRKSSYKSVTIETPSFSPIIFSGDSSLVGTYFLDFALYNSKEKVLYSKWIPMRNLIRVNTEESIRIPSCTGVRSEVEINNQRGTHKTERFRIK